MVAAKVGRIEANVVASQTARACVSLGAIINEVNAQTGKKISATQAVTLVANAQQIMTVIGCP